MGGVAVRVLGRILLQILTKKSAWLGAIVGWLWTDTPVGDAVDGALGLFTGCTITVGVFMTVGWLFLRAQDAKARDRHLDRNLPRPPQRPRREDDDADPHRLAAGEPDREAVTEGQPA